MKKGKKPGQIEFKNVTFAYEQDRVLKSINFTANPGENALGPVYLRCDEGNPGKLFSQIEFNIKGNTISNGNAQDTHYDNLCIMYTGTHGIGSSSTKNLTVTNCDIGWIGGTIQRYVDGKAGRLGNGVEIYGSCDGYLVHNNYIYQCYDAGITNQNQDDVSDSSRTMRNVSFTNNLVERCEMSIEYYLGAQMKPTESIIENFLIEGNILRLAGYGWGDQHPEPAWAAHIKSWWMHQNEAYNFTIRRNIFDRSTFDLLNIGYRDSYSAPKMEGNTYIQYLNADGGHLGQDRKLYRYDKEFPSVMERVFGERRGKYIFISR